MSFVLFEPSKLGLLYDMSFEFFPIVYVIFYKTCYNKHYTKL